MSLWLEHKYVLQAGMYLEQFAKVDDSTFRFRCPICGDSKKSKTLCRGYIYEHESHYEFKCHNCGKAYKSIGNFLAIISQDLYNSYRKELLFTKYQDKGKVRKTAVGPSKSIYEASGSPFNGLEKISSLSPNHPAKKYVVSRKIPNPSHWKLFYCPDFAKWANALIPGKLDASYKEDRILIPLYDEDHTFRGAQGRALGPVADHKRYITILLDKTKPVLYNAENIDFTKKYYVLEGPFDSMFFPNSGALLTATSNYPLKNRDKAVVVLDNQPWNKDVVKQYWKHVEAGDNVCIWPSSIEQKDVNQMVLDGVVSAHDVSKLVDEHTYQGLLAKAQLTRWAKWKNEK